MGNVPERVTAKEARRAVDVMCHRPYTPDERRTAFRYIDQTEAENARLRETLVEVESETAQIWPQSLLDDMPALRRIQDIVRRALNLETTDE